MDDYLEKTMNIEEQLKKGKKKKWFHFFFIN
jgi:hypothetical protein